MPHLNLGGASANRERGRSGGCLWRRRQPNRPGQPGSRNSPVQGHHRGRHPFHVHFPGSRHSLFPEDIGGTSECTRFAAGDSSVIGAGAWGGGRKPRHLAGRRVATGFQREAACAAALSGESLDAGFKEITGLVGSVRCRSGGTGRHTILRGWRVTPCGFESRLRHHSADSVFLPPHRERISIPMPPRMLRLKADGTCLTQRTMPLASMVPSGVSSCKCKRVPGG